MSSSNDDWDTASNHIAKRYIDDDSTARYFDDVMMQMTTKLWAARYNYHKPPKKVLSFSLLLMCNLLCLLFFPGGYHSNECSRIRQPTRAISLSSRKFHREWQYTSKLVLVLFPQDSLSKLFQEGTYIKYNSNSGFVCDDTLRHTPQVLSPHLRLVKIDIRVSDFIGIQSFYVRSFVPSTNRCWYSRCWRSVHGSTNSHTFRNRIRRWEARCFSLHIQSNLCRW